MDDLPVYSMKFECPECGQSLETETMYAGQAVECPTCGANLTTPAPAPALPNAPSPEVIQTLQSNIDRGNMTISQYMAKQEIEGGIDLQSSEDKSSASAILTAEQGRKYKLGDVVAAGGMGAILNAKDVNLRRGVAMKVMLEPDKVSKDQILRFIQEAQVTSQIEHPSIVPIYELGVDGSGNVFYTMKFVKGKTLKDILKSIREGDKKVIEEYPLSHLLTIFQKVCDAIAFAHSKRVIHRDLKPDNVMVGDYGEVQVMDWGLAKVLPKKRKTFAKAEGGRMRPEKGRGQEFQVSGLSPQPSPAIDSVRSDEVGEILKTMDGSIMGTPGFMSPEQALGKTEEVDQRTDIYALGAILYNILTLDVPVKGKTLAELIEKVTSGEIRKPTSYNVVGRANRPGEPLSLSKGNGSARGLALPHLPDNRVPESLSAVAMKALEVDALNRYQTVKRLQKDIESYQGGFATGAEGASVFRQMGLMIKRHKSIFAVMTTMLLILLAAMGIYTRVNIQERMKAQQALKAFQEEQERRQADQKRLAPALVAVARELIAKKDFETALATVTSSTIYDPGLSEGWFCLTVLRFHAGDYNGAVQSATRHKQLSDPEDQAAKDLLAMSNKAAKGGLKDVNLLQLADLLTRKGMVTLAAEYTQNLGDYANKQKAAATLYRHMIEKTWPGQGKNLIGDEKGLALLVSNTKDYMVTDLSVLKGMPITSLEIPRTKVSDLEPLKGMPLRFLSLSENPVSDLTPLKDMPLKYLNIRMTKVTDLSPLKGMQLTNLMLDYVKVNDLTPLKGMPLTSLHMWFGRRIPDLTVLEGMPLKELWLDCPISDLSAIKGLPLTLLSLYDAKVSDLTPLKDMPIKSLEIRTCNLISDLTPLKGKSLTKLEIAGTSVRDLSAIKGMPLTFLAIAETLVSDLRPLEGMPLEILSACGTKISDLTPLKGMPLKDLIIKNTPVSDLSPLSGMELKYFSFTPRNITNGLEVVRNMKSLIGVTSMAESLIDTQRACYMSPAEFWKKYDAGEFNK